jgi:hydroxyacylglutathione hydrolase
MLMKRFFDDGLASASYLVGCTHSREAAVIDPDRDVDRYIEAADQLGVAITAVTETHIHADFVSGARDLSARTGARLYLSDEGGPEWKSEFAAADGATLLRDGDEIRLGKVRLEAMHTPGHTPEHMSFLLHDENSKARLVGAFTGDFVFVGDVGRPDLLETAAKVEGTMRLGAESLYRSIQRFRHLPDDMLIWPSHGAGSSCGKALGGIPDSSLGIEKATNWAFLCPDEEAFIEEVLSNQPEPPIYFANMKRVNMEGPSPAGPLCAPPLYAASRFIETVASGVSILDLRNHRYVEADYIDGTISIPAGRDFPTWAGSVLSHQDPVFLVADDKEQARHCAVALTKIGIDQVQGWFPAEPVMRTVRPRPFPTASSRDFIDGSVQAVDVRKASEREEAKLPTTLHIPLSRLGERYVELSKSTPVAVHCNAGSRALVAASFLRSHGFDAAFYPDTLSTLLDGGRSMGAVAL